MVVIRLIVMSVVHRGVSGLVPVAAVPKGFLVGIPLEAIGLVFRLKRLGLETLGRLKVVGLRWDVVFGLLLGFIAVVSGGRIIVMVGAVVERVTALHRLLVLNHRTKAKLFTPTVITKITVGLWNYRGGNG